MHYFKTVIETPTQRTNLIIEAPHFSGALDIVLGLFKDDTIDELSITQLDGEEEINEQLGNRGTGTN